MNAITVFISYRRDDAGGSAGRLADTLRLALGERGEILRDVDKLIPPGADFLSVITEAIGRSDAFLAVIGPDWLSMRDERGNQRLTLEQDVVRREIIAALDSTIAVIPVLVDDAEMPAASDLPPVIAALAGRNAIELSDARWAEDANRLIEALEQIGGSDAETDPSVALPTAPDSLLGRHRDLAVIGKMFSSRARLITLTGPGGIGKTSVAIEAARAQTSSFEQVAYIDLALVDDPEMVLPAVARAAGVDQPDSAQLLDSIGKAVGDSPVLFVLDNFEHVHEAGAGIARMLANAPGARVLVTSRAALRVSGEREYPVGPLAREDAIALFKERALAVRPDVEFDDDAIDAINEICARLDGLPLAIELAAARVRLLAPRAVVGQLGKRLDLLIHGALDLPQRQQTVRATIDWSYRLLEEPDRELLARMSVFAGGATLAAIHHICASGDDEIAVLNRLHRLAENSLIWSSADVDGQQRFRMLELIREFARERVADERETELLGRRHAEYFADQASLFGPKLQSSNLTEGLRFFDADYANLLESLAWARDGREADLELGLLDWLGDYWYFRGHYAEPWRWFEHALGLDASPERRAAVLRGAGGLRVRMGDLTGARELFVSSLEICERLDDRHGMARALSGLEGCLARMGEFDLAEQAGSRAIEMVRGLGDHRRLALAVSNAGYTALQRGRVDDARERFEEALELAMGVDDAEAMSLAQQNLGLLLVIAGELDRAENLSALGLEGAIALREHLGILAGLVAIAAVRARRGDLEGAARLLGLIDAELDARNYVLDPVEARLYEETMVRAEADLDPERAGAAKAEGAARELIPASQEVVRLSLRRDANGAR